MSLLFSALLVPAGVGIAVAIVLRRFVSGGRAAALAGLGAAAGTAVLVVSMLLVSFGECASENDDRPLSWPWSPRRQLCDGAGSHVVLGAYALLLVPPLLVVMGVILAKRRARVAGGAILAGLLAVPFLPWIYFDSLPVYRLDEYPILHAPLLRPGAEGRPPRVCYAYGIVFGPRKAPVTEKTERTCVELVPTRQALSLTTAYDQGRTIYDLEWMGKNLTARGLPVEPGGTGIDGLVVARVYELPGREALRDSTRIGAS
jgi:hypothetical protein